MYRFYNPNPDGSRVEDCSVRAMSKALDVDWNTAYWLICLQGSCMHNMPHSNSVWGSILKRNGFVREFPPDECSDCYTVEDFCRDYPRGTYVLVIKNHVVTVIDGDWYDSFDSGDNIVIYFWRKEE